MREGLMRGEKLIVWVRAELATAFYKSNDHLPPEGIIKESSATPKPPLLQCSLTNSILLSRDPSELAVNGISDGRYSRKLNNVKDGALRL
jgi:hypothetical protein